MRYKQVEALATEIGAKLSRRDKMTTPWGWRRTNYTITFSNGAWADAETLAHCVELINESRKTRECHM